MNYQPTDAERYVTTQLFAVCPIPVEKVAEDAPMRIKILSQMGETNWINITPEVFRKIEIALLQDATQGDTQ